jgi:hypothetical protein
MECNQNGTGNIGADQERLDGWAAWNAVPRDGPALFAVDATAFDRGVVRGRWLNVGADQAQLYDELTELLGQAPEEGTWAVVDQIGLGQRMAPEMMSVTDLTTVARDLAAESGSD